MEAWINNLFNWIPIGGLYYTLCGLLAFVESLAFIGLLCPGSVLIVFTGFLAANGKGDFVVLATVYALGAIAGDLLSYLLGARSGAAIMERPWFKKREGLLNKAQLYFAGHGGKSVFIGRFVGFLRPFIPFIAGSARMKPLPFCLYALISGILWGISYPGLGYVFGASWQLVKVWSGRFSLIILIIAVLFILNALFWRYLMPLLVKYGKGGGRGLARGWQRLLESDALRAFAARHPRFWAFWVRRFSSEHAEGIILTGGALVCLLFAALFAGFGPGSEPASAIVHLDHRLYDLAAYLHHPWTDAFFAAFTWLGSGQVLAILGALVLLILIVSDRDFSALIFFVGLGGGELFLFVTKELYSRPRPTPLFPGLEAIGASFPSGHAFTALLFYGLVVYFLLGTTRNWQARILLILPTSFIVLLIGASRILLGVHWTSDVLAGYALSALWLSFLITLCEIRFRHGGFGLPRRWRPLSLAPRTRRLILIPAGGLCLALVIMTVAPRLAALSLERAPRPIARLAADPCIEALPADLPLATESLFGKPQRPLSLIVIADEAELRRKLLAARWSVTRETGFQGFKRLLVDLLHDRPPTSGTITPHLVDGRIQDISLLRTDAGADGPSLHTLLIWDLGLTFPNGRKALGLLATRQIGVQHLLGLSLPIPLNDLAVDRERERLIAELTPAKRLTSLPVAIPDPTPATRDDDPFVSDKQVPILLLGPADQPRKETNRP